MNEEDEREKETTKKSWRIFEMQIYAHTQWENISILSQLTTKIFTSFPNIDNDEKEEAHRWG